MRIPRYSILYLLLVIGIGCQKQKRKKVVSKPSSTIEWIPDQAPNDSIINYKFIINNKEINIERNLEQSKKTEIPPNIKWIKKKAK